MESAARTIEITKFRVMVIGALPNDLTLCDFAPRVRNAVFRSSAKRHNIVSSLPGFGLNYPRFVFQAHCLPCFSKAFPPEKLALPLLAKPGFVTIRFRHTSP